MASSRRDFLKSLAVSGMGAAGLSALEAAQAPAHIEILPAEPIGTISPEIYGHFIEHLGGVIYDGVWVGPDSKIPNEGGIRRSLIDALKSIRAPVVRWPGGCFADSYDWRDASAPRRSAKPARTSGAARIPILSARRNSCVFVLWLGPSRIWRRTSEVCLRATSTSG
jgi:alpha-L-arabinofuranosidase